MNLRYVRTAVSALVRGSESTTREERNARNLIASGAFLGFIDGGVVTYLPVWLARLGATPTHLGLLASGPQLVNILTLPLAGAYVERQSDLVRLANRAAILHRIGYVMIAMLPLLLDSSHIPLAAIALWSAITLPAAIHLPAFMSVIQQAVPPQMRPRVNGGRWALWTIVGAILIPIFGVVTDRVSPPFGYQIVFVLSFLGTLPNLYFFGRIEVPPFKERKGQASNTRPLCARLLQFIRPFFESSRFVRYNLATATFRICLSMPAGLYSIFWVDYLQATDTWIGIRGAVAYATLAISYGMWARVANWVGHRSLLMISSLIGLYPIVTGLSPRVEWLVPAGMIWGLFVAAIDIGLVDMLLLACPEGRQPSFVAIANVLSSIELFIGPLIGAAVAHVIGIPAALIVAGLAQLGSGVFFFLLPNHEQEKKESF